ncbi:PIN domain-containing protein [Rhodothermus marinus]|uniref:PIN domain-containing protein n=1 Tax=Rhodothermus marinus TaxID=29549 RepID=UPI0037C6003B
MVQVFLDTNVILDVLLERAPHVQAAAQILAEIEVGRFIGICSATTFTTVYYVLHRARNDRVAREGLRMLLEFCRVAPVTREVIQSALMLSFPDFEDAVQHEAARLAGAEVIVTRNVKDFAEAQLPVYSPEAFLVHYVQK